MTKLQKKNKEFLQSLTEEKKEILADIKEWILDQKMSLHEIKEILISKGLTLVGKGKTAIVLDFTDNLVIRVSNGENGTAYELWAEFAEKQSKSMIVPQYSYIENIKESYSAYSEYIGSIIVMEKLQPLSSFNDKLFNSRTTEFIQVLDQEVMGFLEADKAPKYKPVEKLLIDKRIFDEKDFSDLKRFLKKVNLNDITSANVMFNPNTKKLVLTDPSFSPFPLNK